MKLWTDGLSFASLVCLLMTGLVLVAACAGPRRSVVTLQRAEVCGCAAPEGRCLTPCASCVCRAMSDPEVTCLRECE